MKTKSLEWQKRFSPFQIILSIFFLLAIIFSLVPIINIVAVSLSSKDAILRGDVFLLPQGFNGEAYRKVFSNSTFTTPFIFSILITLTHVILAMVLTVLAAYPLSKRYLPGRSLIMLAIVVTMYFDPGIIPKYLNIKDLGLMDTPWAILIPTALSAYNLIILRSFFSSIDDSLYEAANIDGCSDFRTMLQIAVPLAKPALATLALFYGVTRWNNVSDVLFYIQSSKFFTVQLRLKQYMDSLIITPQESMNTGAQLIPENVKAASIVLAMLPLLIAYPFIQRYFTQGIMVGAVKG